jgi:hypothetical protein
VADTIPGQMQRITVNESGVKLAQIRQTPTTNAPDFYDAGDVIGVYCTVTLEDTALTVAKDIRASLLVVEGGGPAFVDHLASLTAGIPAARASGVVKHERATLGVRFVARAGIYTVAPQLILQTGTYAGSTGGAGYAQFGQVRVVNLTRAGIA